MSRAESIEGNGSAFIDALDFRAQQVQSLGDKARQLRSRSRQSTRELSSAELQLKLR